MARSGRKKKRTQHHSHKLSELSHTVRGHLMDDLEIVGLNPDQRTIELPSGDTLGTTSKRVLDAIRQLATYDMVATITGDDNEHLTLTDQGTELAYMMARRNQRRSGEAKDDPSLHTPAVGAFHTNVIETLADKAAAGETENYTFPDGRPAVRADVGSSIKVTTMSLKRFCAKSRDAGYEHLLPEEVEDVLDPNSLHIITEGTVFPEEGYVTQRINLALKTNEPLSLLLDFSMKDADMMAAAFRTKPQELRGQLSGNIVAPIPLNKPKWVASRSYDYTWEFNDFCRRAVQALVLNGDFRGKNVSFETPEGPLRGWQAERFARSGRAIHGHNIMRLLPEAQVLVVDPELATAITSHDTALGLGEAASWLRDAILPHNPLYLDLEGPGGRPLYISLTSEGEDSEIKVGLRGALLFRDQANNLTLYPIGGDTYLHQQAQPEERKDLAIFGNVMHESYGALFLGDVETFQRSVDTNWYDLKIFDSIGRQTDIHTPVWTQPLETFKMNDQVQEGPGIVMTTQYADLTANEVETGEPLNIFDLEEETVSDTLSPILYAVAAQAVAAINVLFYAAAPNVELIDAPIEKKMLKRARKRDWDLRVSQIVYVKHTSRRNVNRSEPSGRKRHYSHIFKVRAHVRHMAAHTREYQNRPDLVTPCPRCGGCRKIAVREHFRGEGEYIAKTRIARDGEDE